MYLHAKLVQCVCYFVLLVGCLFGGNWSSILVDSPGRQSEGVASLPFIVWELKSQENRMSCYETSFECLVCFQQKCSYKWSIFEVFLKITRNDFNNLHHLCFSTWANWFVFLLVHQSPVTCGDFSEIFYSHDQNVCPASKFFVKRNSSWHFAGL